MLRKVCHPELTPAHPLFHPPIDQLAEEAAMEVSFPEVLVRNDILASQWAFLEVQQSIDLFHE
jgi:hypothetical protein